MSVHCFNNLGCSAMKKLNIETGKLIEKTQQTWDSVCGSLKPSWMPMLWSLDGVWGSFPRLKKLTRIQVGAIMSIMLKQIFIIKI